MARNLRLPNTLNTASLKAENDLVIEVLTAATNLPQGGGSFGSLLPWKKAAPASVYSQFVIEVFSSEATPQLINDGSAAQAIGLWGRYTDASGNPRTALLGVLGYSLGGVMPQITTVDAATGFAQLVNVATVYESISIGGILADVAVPAGSVTVTARPIIERDYGG